MHADKWAPLGAIFAALCVLEVRPATVILSFLGLDFLLRDVVLIPVLVAFLAISLTAFHADRGRHSRTGPVLLAWPASALSIVGLWLPSHTGYAVGTGLALLAVAALWNWRSVLSAPEKPVRRRVPRGPRSPRRRR